MSWYVIQTLSGEEIRCLTLCQSRIDSRLYHEIFIPKYIRQKHYKKEWHECCEILFPSYLFVDTENMEEIAEKLAQVPCYTKILRDGDSIAPIREEEKQFLAQMMDEYKVVRYSEGLIIGEQVCIAHGPLKSMQGYVRSVNRHRRVAILDVKIFGRRTPMEVGFGAVKRLSRDEFHQFCQINQAQADAIPVQDRVKITRGVFAGVYGTFLYANKKKDEWTVQIQLYETSVKVVCHRDEIQIATESEETG